MSSRFAETPAAIGPDDFILLNFGSTGEAVNIFLQAVYALRRLGIPKVLLNLAAAPNTHELRGFDLGMLQLGWWRSSLCILWRGRPEQSSVHKVSFKNRPSDDSH